VWLVALRLTVLAALAVSAVLYVQYVNPAQATFCGVGSGCETVRRSAFGYFGSRFVSLPLLGLAAYGTLLWVSVRAPGSPWVLRLAAVGGAGSAVLLGIQAFVVEAFCSLCVGVDVAALAAPLFAWLAARGGGARAEDPLREWAWGAVAALAVVAPFVWVQVKPVPPVPDVIRALYVPGKVTVVEFADFECPFCRRLHPVLKEVLGEYPKEQIHFVRKHVPLESHEHSDEAARAVVCAEKDGKAELLADVLVTIDLSDEAIRKAALGVGVAGDAFDRCVRSPEAEARLAADTRLLQEAGMQGLPTTYIGGKRLLGLASAPALRDAIDRALRGETDKGVPLPAFLGLLGALFGGVVWLGRVRRGKIGHE